MKDLKNVVACYIDTGLFNELAVQASETFKHVYFYNPSQIDAFPASQDVAITEGFDNITVITNFFDYLKYFDLCVFTDIYQGDLQEHLRSLGMPVWGSGKSEWLERDRMRTTEWMLSVGLPTPERKEIIGIDGLRKLPKDWFIKIDNYRYDAETFKKMGNPQMDSFFDSLALILGHRKSTYKFMAEKMIPDAIEFGVDIYSVNGDYPKYGLYGLEVKGSSYGGKMGLIEGLPQSLKKVNDALSDVFKQERMKGQFSTEVRVTKRREGFLIDPCLRNGNPPHQSQMEIIGNLPEIAWAGASGELVEPKIKARYCAQCTMTSEFAALGEVAFEIPDKVKRFIKVKNVAKSEGVYYYIPNKDSKIETVGAVVGLGNTLDEAIKNCKDNASEVKAFQLEIDLGALDTLSEEIAKSKSYGITF